MHNSKTEWNFTDLAAEVAVKETTLEAAIDSLPSGVGVKKATELLRATHPELVFSTRDIREALLLLAVVPSPSAAISSTPAEGVAARLEAHISNFIVRHAGESGLGCYATRDIKRGERILAESPLVEWHIAATETISTAAIDTLVADLGPEDKQDYYGLCQNAEHGAVKTPYGIWLSNAYPIDSPLEAAQNKLAGVNADHRSVKRGAIFAGVSTHAASAVRAHSWRCLWLTSSPPPLAAL